MMIQKHFSEIVIRKFGFELSSSQNEAVEKFTDFLFNKEDDGIFLLKGYAGTGKLRWLLQLLMQ